MYTVINAASHKTACAPQRVLLTPCSAATQLCRSTHPYGEDALQAAVAWAATTHGYEVNVHMQSANRCAHLHHKLLVGVIQLPGRQPQLQHAEVRLCRRPAQAQPGV